MPDSTTVSVAEIPTIVRRKSTQNFTQIDTDLSKLKANQAKVYLVPRTKKNELDRQFSVKIAKHLGNAWTVTSRMGNERLQQNPQELYCYIYKTPLSTESS